MIILVRNVVPSKSSVRNIGSNANSALPTDCSSCCRQVVKSQHLGVRIPFLLLRK